MTVGKGYVRHWLRPGATGDQWALCGTRGHLDSESLRDADCKRCLKIAPFGVDLTITPMGTKLGTAPETSAPHVHDMVEVALTDDCDYGCKVLACKCGERVVSHRRVYGCPQGDVTMTDQQRADAAHADCDAMIARIAKRGSAGMDLIATVRRLYAYDRYREGLPSLAECTPAQLTTYYQSLRHRLQDAVDRLNLAAV